jgi:hypothetical protein
MRKRIINALAIMVICTSAAFAQSNSGQSRSDTAVKNQNKGTHVTNSRTTSSSGENERTGSRGAALKGGQASNAGKRTNANNESKISKGGKAAQGQPTSSDKANQQPAKSRIGSSRENSTSDSTRKGSRNSGRSARTGGNKQQQGNP